MATRMAVYKEKKGPIGFPEGVRPKKNKSKRGTTHTKLNKPQDKADKEIEKLLREFQKEVKRKTEIYGSVRTSKIAKIRRSAKKADAYVTARDLGIMTAREMRAKMNSDMAAYMKAMKKLDKQSQVSRMKSNMIKLNKELQEMIEYYELQLEQIELELRGGQVPKEAQKLYELMKGLLLEGMSAAESYAKTKAEKMYEYTIKVVDEPVTWMKYAMRLLNYLPDIEAVVERYMYSSDQSYIIYNFGGGISYNDENRYECWNKVIRIFWENVFDDSQFYMWMQTATAREKKSPSKASVQRTMFETYVQDSVSNPRFAIDLDTSGLD